MYVYEIFLANSFVNRTFDKVPYICDQKFYLLQYTFNNLSLVLSKSLQNFCHASVAECCRKNTSF